MLSPNNPEAKKKEFKYSSSVSVIECPDHKNKTNKPNKQTNKKTQDQKP